VVNANLRLHPTNASAMREVYTTFFLPFMKKTSPTARPISLTTFTLGSRNSYFKDVSKRSKHFHCRCATCAQLAAEKRTGWKNGTDNQETMAKVI